MKKEKVASSISSLDTQRGYEKYATHVLDVVLYKCYDWYIFQ